jgi:predicted site-specific integrase-resolvase
MWLTVKEYAEKHGISDQATRKRMKKGYIPPSRISKNDGGKIIIKERDLNE